MKRFNIKLLMIMLLGTILLTGCNKIHFGAFNGSKDDGNPTITSVPSISVDNNSTGTTDPTGTAEIKTTEGAAPTNAVIQPLAISELPIYSVNADTGDIEPATKLLPKDSEITAQLIVDTVVEALQDQSINVGIDNVSQDGKTVIVSFKKDTPPSTNTGSGYEAAILDAFAQSLMDNLDVRVIFRIEGNAYASGVFEYGIDEAYPGNN